MLDRVDADAQRALHAFGAVGVGGDAETVVLRGAHHGAQLVLGVLRVVAAGGLAQHAASGGHLDQVGAVLVAGAHRLARFLGAVQYTFDRAGRADLLGQEMRQVVGRVGVAAGGGQRFTGGEHARARHFAGGDGALERDVQVVGGAQVAHRREAGHQGALGILHRTIGHVGRIGGQAVAVGVDRGLGLAGQVHVHIDQARQAAVARQVDIARSLRHRSHRHDAAVLDHDADALAPCAFLDIQQPAAVDRLGGGVRAVQGQQHAGGNHLFHLSLPLFIIDA